ncbi:hypothetical protein G7048_01055 [Diaphorobacter sp. HDW4B]|uniref:hypothetical protein n=1 Tax=Diaphorobacter sp. HDW4B TaxID=2714925 RepID=UPI001409A992|nr:hypothetical protein [Diaphorobacter sp. HDW4B]QIL69104.1 hypothetical protein G7048_01055 [Diaphorobacter sp. HDW4B]
MPGGIARSLRVTAQRSGQGSQTACQAASASPMRADLDGENDVARWVQQQASPTNLPIQGLVPRDGTLMAAN